MAQYIVHFENDPMKVQTRTYEATSGEDAAIKAQKAHPNATVSRVYDSNNRIVWPAAPPTPGNPNQTLK